MNNTNCIEGIKCPACGNAGRFLIAGTSLFPVNDEGTEDHADVEWDDHSYTECARCHQSGTLKDFKSKVPLLPPDPDGMNFDRASWADKAISAFRDATGTDREDALSDLLAGLMHWANRARYAFDEALDRAREHYRAETIGE